jgi:hypothetical protein
MGRTVTLVPGSGTVLVRVPGSRSFVRLAAGDALPVGTQIDARRGTVNLTSAAGAGATQTAAFSGGIFEVRQSRTSRMTDLILRGTLAGCPKPRARTTARAAAKRKRPVRRLWGNGHGRFRTHGTHAIAAVRGTKWLTEDRCDGTLVRVDRGVVEVTPAAPRGRKTLVRAGARRLVRHRR